MHGSAFRYMDIAGAFRLMFWLLVAAIPLAIWKLVDIAIWAASHVSVSFG